MRAIIAATAIAAALGAASVRAADVHIGINIGVPPPPAIVVPAPPRLVVVPTTPAVLYAPELPANYFFYGGSYYTFHEGAWFIASAYDGPWAYVERVHVPHPLLVVPYRYYRVPPHHVHPVYGYHGHPHGMPPGQAKKLYGWDEHGHGRHDRD